MSQLEQFYLHFIKPIRGYILGAGLMVAAFAIAIFTSPNSEDIAKKWEPYHRELYQSWCRIENRSDVTFEDWLRLYKANLLRKGK